MKRRYAYKQNDNYKLLEIDKPFFKGYACFLKLQNVEKPLVVFNGKEEVCIKNNDYEWIEVYPTNGKFAITIMYDNKGNLIEWYFDISKNIGIENGIPYEDDLYLDMVITPSGERIVLDENELLEAKENGVITQDDVNNAYKTLSELEEKYVNNFGDLVRFTDYLLDVFKSSKFEENMQIKK